MGVTVAIKELKEIAVKLNLAIEKSKINPKAGWIEIETRDNKIVLKVSNYDYFVQAYVPCSETSVGIHATISSDTFIPLIAKLDGDSITFSETNTCLIMDTENGEYTFPEIKEMGKVKELDRIDFNRTNCTHVSYKAEDVASIADANAKGLLDSMYARDIQQYVYVDERGAITFTENIYINSFNPIEENNHFKFLLSATQAKLTKIFDGEEEVDVMVEATNGYEEPVRVYFRSSNIGMVVITPSAETTDKFPSIKLRRLADAVSETHAIIDKKALEKALNRLMVFDKKFDITVLNYSQLTFGKESVKLVSIKNKNYEVVPYIRGENTEEHTSMIRFADLVKQLKAINTKEIDISYGASPAIVINGNIKQMIPEIRMVE